MEKQLSQSEIDALFRAARGGASTSAQAEASVVERWDLHQAGLMSKDQLHSINQLHESFARNLTGAMSGVLREKFEVALVAVEQLTYRDLLARFADVTYYSTFRLVPGDARGVLHLDLSLALPIVDVLLGGTGILPEATREITEIEESVLESIGNVVCHELQVVANLLNMQAEFERCVPATQMLRIMPPEERTLTLTFDATMVNSKGMLNVIFPSVFSSALMRKLRAELVYERARGPALSQAGIGKQLLKSRVLLELATPKIPVRLMELLSLKPGAILGLHRDADEPALLGMRGREWWSARAVSSRNLRAAQLVQHLPQEEAQP